MANVTKARATIRAMAEELSLLAAQRLLVLMRQLCRERYAHENLKARGVQKWLSGRLGVHKSLLNKVINPQSKSGRDTIDITTAMRVGKKLGIENDFFTNPALGPKPDYRRHLIKKRGPISVEPKPVELAASRADVELLFEDYNATADEQQTLLDAISRHDLAITASGIKLALFVYRAAKKAAKAADALLDAAADNELRRSDSRTLPPEPASDGEDEPTPPPPSKPGRR